MGIEWILECIQRPMFSILVNGNSCRFFNNSRDLRHECPLSPYLFAIVMEFFTAVLFECDKNRPVPSPFTKGGLAISHLLFADDVLLFVSASAQIAGNIKRFLQDFDNHSGLGINWEKAQFSSLDAQLTIGWQSPLCLTFSREAYQYDTLGCLFSLQD